MGDSSLNLRDLIIDHASSDEGGPSVADLSFSAVSLHNRTALSWAVIGDDSGAIAQRNDGTLHMRMREEDAVLIAIQLTAAAQIEPTLH